MNNFFLHVLMLKIIVSFVLSTSDKFCNTYIKQKLNNFIQKFKGFCKFFDTQLQS